MSITLVCLVKGNLPANAFAVDINSGKLVSHLKELIKKKLHPSFEHVTTKDIKLWKVEIPDDHDAELADSALADELLATKKISRYFSSPPAEEYIHVIVEPPVPTASSSREQELLDRIASLEASINKSVHDFDVVVHPKRKANKWTTNIEHATLEGLKDYIRKEYEPPSLEKDGAVLKFISGGKERYSPRNDQELREMLQLFVVKNSFKFTVLIETPSKAFSDWTFPKVCELYNLSEDPNPDVSVFPTFPCGCSDTKNEKFQTALDKLMLELKTRLATTPINLSYEATKTIYTYSYLASAVSLFETLIRIRPEKLIEGKNGQGKTDYAMESCATGRIIGVVEVKREDFLQGIAQASVQMESSLTSRKRKVDELETEQVVGSVFAIVTDAKEFYFLECTLDEQEKPSFKLSKPVVVVYEDEDMKVKVEKVLSHIVWLLEEVQKADELEGGNKRVKID